jgi:aspartyl-tRNA(Asn)/glutamyl-tRNA(Gln) amidotransferase subunit B
VGVFLGAKRLGGAGDTVVVTGLLHQRAALGDDGELTLDLVLDAIAGNDKAREQFLGGKESAINAFKGPVMKASRGQANPKLVDETLRRLLAEG